MSVSRWAWPAFKAAVPLILAFFIGRMIHANWAEVRAEPWRLEPGWLALSFVPASGWFLLRPLGWKLLLRGFGHDVPYGEIYRIFRKAELTRYVPGGVWQFASRIYLTKRYGVGASECLAATILDTVLAGLAAVVPAAWLAASASGSLAAWQRVALAAFPLAALAIVYPRVLNFWAAPLARLLKQSYRPLAIGARQILWIWAMYVGMWGLLAFAMGFFARALLPEISASQLAFIAGCYALAWLAALLMMIAPGGVGLREGILGLLLAQTLAAGTAMTLAVAMRLWLVVMEVVWFAASPAMPRALGSRAD